jgi:hypothetical protein
MTLEVMAALALPPDRRESELFWAGWPAAADRPAIHTYIWHHGQSRIDDHRTSIGQDKAIGIITAPHVRNMKATDLTTNAACLRPCGGSRRRPKWRRGRRALAAT